MDLAFDELLYTIYPEELLNLSLDDFKPGSYDNLYANSLSLDAKDDILNNLSDLVVKYPSESSIEEDIDFVLGVILSQGYLMSSGGIEKYYYIWYQHNGEYILIIAKYDDISYTRFSSLQDVIYNISTLPSYDMKKVTQELPVIEEINYTDHIKNKMNQLNKETLLLFTNYNLALESDFGYVVSTDKGDYAIYLDENNKPQGAILEEEDLWFIFKYIK